MPSRRCPSDPVPPALQAENERLTDELTALSRQLDAISADRDRLASLLVIERAIFESQLATAEDAGRELAALKATKVLRYTSILRKTYGTIRRIGQTFRSRR